MVGAVVLCGGKSSRMGADKASLPFGAESMLQRVVRLIQPAASRIVVVAAPDQLLPELPDAVWIARDPQPGWGPLQGIAVGLAELAPWTDAAFVTSCDAPFLRAAWLRRLADLLDDPWDIVAPTHEDRPQPLSAVYRTCLASKAFALLAEGERRPWTLMQQSRTLLTPAEALRDIDPLLESLRNLNHPQDYQQALKELE